MTEWRVPLSDLDYGPEEESAVLRVLRSRWLSMGPEVAAFEQEFAVAARVAHAVALSNATTALHATFLSLGIGPGDEVIQPALNFVATANMTVAVGARPVFADIVSLQEPTIDPSEVERRISSRTKAVVVMHYGGYPCRMNEIVPLCARRGIPVVEDACHAPGVVYQNPAQQQPHGRSVGALGRIACFSFFSNKNIATGEGGMVTTDDPEIAATLRQLRSHGMTTLTWDRHRGHASSYDVQRHGYNYRLDEMRAALGREQLKKLPAGNARRRHLIRCYHQGLSGMRNLSLPFADWSGDFAGHLMPVLAADANQRETIVAALRQDGIQTSLHYPDIPRFTAFRADCPEPPPCSREFSERVITLPIFPGLREAQVEQITRIIQDACC